MAVSFVVLALAWRTPRFDAAVSGPPAPGWLAAGVDSTAWTVVCRVVGLVVAAYVAFAAVAGPDLVTNPVFGVVYVLLWVGLVPASLLCGPLLRACSPLRTVSLAVTRIIRGDADRGALPLPAWVGQWPAALGLFAFVWLELVYPESTYLAPVRLWLVVYVVVLVMGGVLFGRRWFAAADPFEAYSTLVAHLSVWGRRSDGTLVMRSPLGNLDGVPATPGLVAVVAVLFGSTAFDSFKDSNAWLRFVQSAETPATVLNTVALVGFCAVVGLSLTAATMATAVGSGVRRRDLPALFAHSVVPIVVGYVVAHYLSYFVETGQRTLIQLSDPLARGWNLLGTADWQVSYWLSTHPTLLAVLKVVAVVIGHVLGVIAAHDRAIRLLPPRSQLTGQLPLLLVMVCYTVIGLSLLFGA